VLAQLGDHHSHLIPRDTVLQLIAAARRGPPEIPGQVLKGRIGYLGLPSFASPDTATQRPYAARAQETLAHLDRAAPCGWVVDLRSNSGGSSYPMLAAVGPLLGDGVAGAYVDANGARTAWGYRGGAAWLGTDTVVRVPSYRLRASRIAVAVLTGAGTASAAEQVAIAFRSLPYVRSFGAPTWGVPSSNGAYALPDSSAIAVTEARMADRNGQVYDGPIVPDQLVDADLPAANDAARPWDSTAQAAMTWLLAQPACRERVPNVALEQTKPRSVRRRQPSSSPAALQLH
jgi:C-terminal processing protease CtpA/Prc